MALFGHDRALIAILHFDSLLIFTKFGSPYLPALQVEHQTAGFEWPELFGLVVVAHHALAFLDGAVADVEARQVHARIDEADDVLHLAAGRSAEQTHVTKGLRLTRGCSRLWSCSW